ncbi:MAG: MBL fold metallo-hydrolase [Planctomycetes bacterium]|nr:MBL fold metallo-hydrolase [Planctomycetota bacterium]
MIEPISGGALRLGDARVDLLDGGAFRLDGGAMFRVVPRALWAPLLPPDDQNRVTLAMRPLLVRTGGRTVLLDAGIGPERRDARFAERVALAAGPPLEDQLAALGVAPDQVDLVVLTHLHFDHAGGLVRADGRPRFPRARVVVQRDELDDAAADCPLCRASYVQDDWAPLTDLLAPVAGDAEVAPGVRVVRTGGHTRGHQVVRVDGGGATLAFWGDLVPTAAHLRPHWVMGFDLYPVEAFERKRDLLGPAVDAGWAHVLYHEPAVALGRVVAAGRGQRLEAFA